MYALTTGVNSTSTQQIFSPELAEAMREMEIAEELYRTGQAVPPVSVTVASEVARATAARATEPVSEPSFGSGFKKGFFDKKSKK